MALTMGAILALLGIAVAVYPFLRRRFFSQLTDVDDRQDEDSPPAEEPPLLDLLQSIYEAIRTLQLERELGNVPEGLYREQLNAYRVQAAMVLRAYTKEHEQSLGGGPALEHDWALEEEIRVARAGLYRPSKETLQCPNCGSPVPEGMARCRECEAVLVARQVTETPEVQEAERAGK